MSVLYFETVQILSLLLAMDPFKKKELSRVFWG